MTAMPGRRSWSRISAMPQRGQISWFEIVLLGGCAVWVGFGLAPALQDIVVLSFLFAGLAGHRRSLVSFRRPFARLEYRRRLRRIDLVRPRRVFWNRRLYVDDPV